LLLLLKILGWCVARRVCALENKVSDFPVPSPDVTYQTLPGRE
jgi:hypothetical protein